jgi:hypothetical protein
LISLTCSILVSIALYLKIEDILEKENTSARAFYVLSVEIFKILSLDRDHRVEDPKAFLDDCLAQYNRLIENSCLTNLKLKDKLAPIDLAPMRSASGSLGSSSSQEEIPILNNNAMLFQMTAV